MKPGRNDPCTCGSGRKFKNCCEGKAAATSGPPPNQISELLALYNARLYPEMEVRAQSLLRQYPGTGFIWKLLGAAQQMQGKIAVTAFQKAAELMPEDAEVHFNLGVVLKLAGKLDEAAASYRRALAIRENYAEAHSNLGNVLKDLGQLDAAVQGFRRALQIKPNSPEAHNNLGTALKDLGRIGEAVESYRHALQLHPNYGDAYYNLGNALREQGQLSAAVASYESAIQLRPGHSDTHNNLATTYKELSRYQEALASYQRAVEINPGFAEAYGNIGSLLKDIGDLDGAISNYRRALELKPDYADAQSSLLFILNYSAIYSAEYCLDQARIYGRMASSKAFQPFVSWACDCSAEPLRVGMVSGDLRNHPVGYFLEGLLAHIDPARIELFAYPTDRKSDELTLRIKPRFSAWRPLAGLSNEQAARLIHGDGLHILLDLSGHTAHNRLPVFAWKPAPLQASWLGYFATTGVREMDYVLADQVGVPEKLHANFTESIRYLPDTRLCFSAPQPDLPVAPLPAQSNRYVTFGSFQNLAKVNKAVIAAWSGVLAALPSARLRWQCKQFGDAVVATKLHAQFEQQGIDAARVSLLGAVDRNAYLAAHSEVDVLLDTFPYPGGTTTCEALWMGVPTLTLSGNTLLSRQGASLLHAAGLSDWIAESEQEYLGKAMAFGRDWAALSALRSRLRAQVGASALFDASRFARNFEGCLEAIWIEKRDADASCGGISGSPIVRQR
ncbi:MAG: tetratricopeptide repeat protein [Gallionella sp.]